MLTREAKMRQTQIEKEEKNIWKISVIKKLINYLTVLTN